MICDRNFIPRRDRDDGRHEGERRRDAAHDLFAVLRAKILLRARRAMIGLVLTRDEATADDLRDLVELPIGIDPTCLGAVPGMLARAGIVRRVGYRPSCRPEAHARPVSVWTLANAQNAIQWLREHPEPDDPGAADGAA